VLQCWLVKAAGNADMHIAKTAETGSSFELKCNAVSGVINLQVSIHRMSTIVAVNNRTHMALVAIIPSSSLCHESSADNHS
jgi:hypothetical protein